MSGYGEFTEKKKFEGYYRWYNPKDKAYGRRVLPGE